MSKILLVVLVLGIAALTGFAVKQLSPDIQRYLRLRNM